MIDPEAIDRSNGRIALCVTCFKQLENDCKPAEALANFRWIGPVPPELQGLSWIEEMLIARAHVVGKVIRFQDRSVNGYASLKGHIVVLPQDTTTLLAKLPLSPASLKDIVFLVWVGGAPKREKLSRYFTVRKQKVLDALHWLCANHEDYREIAIDENELSSWESVFVTESLLDSIARISSTSADDTAQIGLATEDVDNDKVEGDLPITTSAILDANSVNDSADVATLERVIEMKKVGVINVVNGTKVMDDGTQCTYFTSSFPTLLPWGTAKHLNDRRDPKLSFETWIQLMLRNSSRYVVS